MQGIFIIATIQVTATVKFRISNSNHLVFTCAERMSLGSVRKACFSLQLCKPISAVLARAHSFDGLGKGAWNNLKEPFPQRGQRYPGMSGNKHSLKLIILMYYYCPKQIVRPSSNSVRKESLSLAT